MIDSVVFDLDGTLWDTCASCAIAWNIVLDRHGIRFRPITDDDVRRVVGKPHEQCIREVFVRDLLRLVRARPVLPGRRVLGGPGMRVPFIHVEYGFGECRDADGRFASFPDLTDWLLGQVPRRVVNRGTGRWPVHGPVRY